MGFFDKFRKNKEKPDFSNVQSGASSTAPAPEPRAEETLEMLPLEARYEETNPQPPVVNHEVQRGDTLWALARRYYGKGARWRDIYRANTDIIDDPDVIRPGQILHIPLSNKGFA